jgi:hypothetical protein
MKKLIIRNLRNCFEHNLTFTELAEFEENIFLSKDIPEKIQIGKNCLKFKNATMNEKKEVVLYYEYQYLPF